MFTLKTMITEMIFSLTLYFSWAKINFINIFLNYLCSIYYVNKIITFIIQVI